MKKLSSVILFLFIGIALSAQYSAEYIVNQFVLPASGGVFRGFDFETMEEDIEDVEGDRRNVTFSFDEIDDDLYYTGGYDIDFDSDHYVYMDYKIDFIGIYEILASIYTSSDSKALAVFNELNKYYTNKLGLGTLESDGWTRFEGDYRGDPYDVWIYLDEDEDGKYVRFELIYMGE